MKIPGFILRRLLGVLLGRVAHQRPADVAIGGWENPYLLRWYVIPRNRWMNIYLHNFRRSDEDRALHDHPWASVSIILEGGYLEWMPRNPQAHDSDRAARHSAAVRRPGDVVARGARALHRVELHGHAAGTPIPGWTLFVTGPKVRDWGFLCLSGWVPWQKFCDPSDRHIVGPGCDADHPKGQPQP